MLQISLEWQKAVEPNYFLAMSLFASQIFFELLPMMVVLDYGFIEIVANRTGIREPLYDSFYT